MRHVRRHYYQSKPANKLAFRTDAAESLTHVQNGIHPTDRTELLVQLGFLTATDKEGDTSCLKGNVFHGDEMLVFLSLTH